MTSTPGWHHSHLLAAHDDALADGQSPADLPAPSELASDLDLLRRLHGVWPAQADIDSDALTLCQAPSHAGAVSEPRDPQAPEHCEPALLGPFRLVRELGRGGFGLVYLAEQPALCRLVALKVPRPEVLLTSDMRSRFLREGHLAAELDHPHLVPVYEAGEVGPICYIASAYVPGVSLRVWLDQHRDQPMDCRLAARLVTTLAEAMHHAHQRGILHRDLKPANVLLQQVEATDNPDVWPAELGIPRICDFGLGRYLDASTSETQSGALLGTPQYMAPEQASGRIRDVGVAADVYALGSILYECLVGRSPFQGESPVVLLQRIASEPPAPPRRLRPAVLRDLETICLKCLHKDPRARYESAQALADDLRRFQEGVPITARPVGSVERLWRWAGRHPAQAALSVIVTVALMVSLTLLMALFVVRGREEAQRYVRLVNEARALIARPRPGWTWNALDKLEKAAALSPAAEQLADLRSDAAECLVAVDARHTRTIARKINPTAIAWHPNGRLIALGEWANPFMAEFCSVALVDLTNPDRPRRLPIKQKFVTRKGGLRPDLVKVLVFSQDGRWLIAGMRSGMLHCWDLEQREPRTVSWTAHADEVRSAVFSPDGRSLYTCGGINARRWTVGSWTEAAVFQADIELRGLDVHPTEGWIACLGIQLLCLDAALLRPIRSAENVAGDHLRFTFDGGCLLIARDDKVKVYHPADSTIRRYLPSDPTESVRHGIHTGLALSPDGTLLLTISRAEDIRHVRLWDLASGRVVVHLVTDAIGAVAFAPDGRSFAVTSETETRLYEVGGLREQTIVALHPGNSVQGFALAPDGRSLLCELRRRQPGVPSRLEVWPLDASGPTRAVAARTVFNHFGDLLPLTLSSTGRLAFSSQDEGTNIWDLRNDKVLPCQPKVHCEYLRFDPAGRLWGVVADEVRLWSATGRAVATYRHRDGHGLDETGKPEIRAVAPGRRWTPVACRDGCLVALKLEEGKLQLLGFSLLADAPVRCVALAPDEQMAAAGTAKGGLLLARLPDCEKLAEMSDAHPGGIVAVDFSANGLLASGGADGIVRLWHLEGDKLCEVLVLRHARPVSHLAFHTDGVQLFVLLDNERAVRVHHLDRLRAGLEKPGLGNGLELIQAVPR